MAFVSEQLTEQHVLSSFDSSNAELDRWLANSAQRAQVQGTGRTWVWHTGDHQVVAYFTLAARVLQREVLPRSQQRSVPREIPAILLAKLALDRQLHGQHLGEQLLLDALTRCVAAGQLVGSRYVLVDAIDDQAAGFYVKYGFCQIPQTTPTRLTRRLPDVAADLAGGSS
jgi:ribosomal protein S18 acetylase RimI-like enzyme